MTRTVFRSRLAPLVTAIVLLSSCGSDIVRLPDCLDCRPVEMTMDQSFEAELGWGIRPSETPAEYTWIVVDPGSMTVVSETAGTRSEDPDEFVGGISHYALITLEPTESGATAVRFELVDADGGVRETLEIAVVVSE